MVCTAGFGACLYSFCKRGLACLVKGACIVKGASLIKEGIKHLWLATHGIIDKKTREGEGKYRGQR